MSKSPRNNQAAVGLLFAAASFVCLAFVIWGNSGILFKKFDPSAAEKKYDQSQWQQSQNVAPDKVLDEWAIKNGYTGWKNFEDENREKLDVTAEKRNVLKKVTDKGISDSFLYSYAGYKYVKGENPALLNPEHPPFAKTLIGISILLAGSEHVLGIVIAGLTLILVGMLSYRIRRSYPIAGLSMLLVSVFPLFADQIISGPQLELYQLFFFLLFIILMMAAQDKKKPVYFVPAGIAYGLLLSTKTLLPFFLLFTGWTMFSFRKNWRGLLVVYGTAAISFVATYYSFFLHGGTVRTFLGLQKYIVTYYGNSNIPVLEFAGNYLRLIFTGSWKFWDSARSVTFYSGWNILWPILFVVPLWKLRGHAVMYKTSLPLIWFVLLYNLFVFIVPVFPRYLLLLYVPLIILI